MSEFLQLVNKSVENHLNDIRRSKSRSLPPEAEAILSSCLPGMIEDVFAQSRGNMNNFSPMATFRSMYVYANPEAEDHEEYKRATTFKEVEKRLKDLMYKPNSYQRAGSTILERFIKTPMEWLLLGVTSQTELDKLREEKRHKPKPIAFYHYSSTKYDRTNGFQRF